MVPSENSKNEKSSKIGGGGGGVDHTGYNFTNIMQHRGEGAHAPKDMNLHFIARGNMGHQGHFPS